MSEARRTIGAALLAAAVALLLYAIHPAFFVRDDFQLQYLPGSREVARAWMSGEFPLLSQFSWLCAGLGAEYQFGVFSVVRTLLDIVAWLLPLSLTGRGAFLVIVHMAVAAAGAFRLARSYGASPSNATMAAVAVALNGWILWWGTTWFPGVASFAWLPWYWLALRGMMDGRRWSWLGAAVSLYLLVSAGWPYSVAMAAAVAAMHFLTALARRRWRAAVAMSGASFLGVALAAPAVLMLLEFWPYTARESMGTQVDPSWFLPIGAWLGAVIPSFSVLWPVFVGWYPHASVELLGAFVPLAALVAAWRRDFVRRHAPELLLLFVVVSLMLMRSAGPFRWSFRWLPLFHLALAMVGVAGLEQARRRVPLAGLALVGATAVAAFALDHELRTTLLHAAVVAALCVAWARFGRIAALMPAAITAVMIVLTFGAYAHRGEVPRFPYDDALLHPAPFDPSRRYLAMYDMEQIVEADEHDRFTVGRHTEWRPGNVPMLAGVEFLNGYSPLGIAAMRNIFAVDVHGPMPPKKAEELLDRETGPNQLLHHAGVDGLIVPEALARPLASVLASRGWRPAARLGTSVILHRHPATPEPLFAAARAFRATDERQAYAAILGRLTPHLPVVLFTPGASGVVRYGRRVITDVEEGRNQTTFLVRDRGPKALIVFRRAWLPGWRAALNGEPLPVLRANMFMPAVEIPENATGRVRLYYRPRSLVVGAWVAGAALVVLAVVAVLTRRKI